MNIKHLKAKILDLAIRGKLVPQAPSEGNAADLLKKIREEKSILIEQKKIKAEKNSSFIIKADDGRHYEQFADGSLIDIEDDIPFDIPENWCWCRLPELCTIPITDGTHQTPTYSDKENGIPFLSSKDVTNQIIDWSNIKYITKELHEELYKRVAPQKGDVLLAKNGTTGVAALVEDDRIFDIYVTLAVLRPNKTFVSPRYLLWTINSPVCKEQFNAHLLGIGVPNLHLYEINKTLIPLPPLSEQQRIVSAIEKAFEQIDIIEKNKLNLKIYIKQTKSKVLDLAIHGKLVKQNPSEGNPYELLGKIRKEKNELIKQKKLKEDKKSSFIFKAENGKHYEHFADGTLKDIEDEIPFEIPENWCWCRLPEISNSILAGGDRPTICTKKKTSENNIPIYANAVDKEGLYGFTNKPQVTEKAITISARGTIGFTCIREEPFVPIVRLIVLVPNLTIIQLKYLKSTFDTLLNMTEGSSIPQLTIPSIKTFLFSLPPIEEQKRIIERIEQIFEQLDILEKSLGE